MSTMTSQNRAIVVLLNEPYKRKGLSLAKITNLITDGWNVTPQKGSVKRHCEGLVQEGKLEHTDSNGQWFQIASERRADLRKSFAKEIKTFQETFDNAPKTVAKAKKSIAKKPTTKKKAVTKKAPVEQTKKADAPEPQEESEREVSEDENAEKDGDEGEDEEAAADGESNGEKEASE
jgi:hypothetical protein